MQHREPESDRKDILDMCEETKSTAIVIAVTIFIMMITKIGIECAFRHVEEESYQEVCAAYET